MSDELVHNVRLRLAPGPAQLNTVRLSYQPPNVGNVPSVDTSNLAEIKNDTDSFLHALDERRAARIAAYKTWEQDALEKKLSHQRRLAPGYLDSGDHILTPRRS